ncbi:MAG TPA: UbiH/UbiF/VisC/COQ6 family ubiquinone biosynthesis hydroxylase [Hyphomicrobiaceae bacterium]|nr:UbiH/UbiF/VisC/COQ6 family ubiquinone biosynthesis hydroxylase [Hyphomicrobiaceae bacterium]
MHGDQSRDSAELIIVGGGLVGLSLAIACAEGGIDTIVVEAESPETLTNANYDGRTCAIAHGSQQVLTAIGAWAAMAPHAQPIVDIRVTDGGWHVKGESRAYVHYSTKDLPRDEVRGASSEPVALRPLRADNEAILACEPGQQASPFGYIVENRITRIALLARARQCDRLRHIAPHLATSLDLDAGSARVTLDDGRILSGQLVVAADGKQSALRRMAGINARNSDYKQTAIVCTVSHTKPHRGVAHEHFLPAGPFAMLPMTDERLADGGVRHRSSIVWSEDPRLVPMLLKLEDAEFGKEIERRFGLSLGNILPLGPRFSYPLTMLLADAYARDRFALVGDAAHGIHPIAGQGFNLGVRDVAALAEILVEGKRGGLDIGSMQVLERYVRWRRFDNLMLSSFMDGLTRLFSNDVAPVRLARDAGFFLFNRIMPLKRLAMRHAMGVVGKLPRLVQGKPL